MRRLLVILLVAAFGTGAAPVLAYGQGGVGADKPVESLAKQRRYVRGPHGGCYYINRNGNRTYVDRSLCSR